MALNAAAVSDARTPPPSSMMAMDCPRPWPGVVGKPYSLVTALGGWPAAAAWGVAKRTDLGVATGRWSRPSTASTRSATSEGAVSTPLRARSRPRGWS